MLRWTPHPASPRHPPPGPPSTQPARAAPPAPLRIVALGDSVTAGTNCDCTPFPDLYAHTLSSRHHIGTTVANDGVPGQTSTDLLRALTDPAEATAIHHADVISITIGANDVTPMAEAVLTGSCGDPGDELACTRPALDTLGQHLQAALHQVRALRQGQRTAVLLTGYWNVYEDGTVADNDYTPAGRQHSAHLTDAVNNVIKAAAHHDNSTYIDLKAAFASNTAGPNPSNLLAGDGDHPNAAGHTVIAKALVAAGVAPLNLPH